MDRVAENKNKHVDNNIVDFGMLPEFLGYHVRLAQIAIFRDFVASLADYDITPTQFGTLAIIEANPGIKQTDLAQAVQLDRSTVVALLDRLEKQELITRERVVNDRRTNALKLTRQGNSLLTTIKPLVLAHEKRLTSKFSMQEKQQLVELLEKIFPDQQSNSK